MHVTSNYYRCRAQRAVLSAESLTLQGGTPHASPGQSEITASAVKPLTPSRRTLRLLADLRKPENHNRVA